MNIGQAKHLTENYSLVIGINPDNTLGWEELEDYFGTEQGGSNNLNCSVFRVTEDNGFLLIARHCFEGETDFSTLIFKDNDYKI